ncbi:hypothetical protein RRG08_035273 [Elysia crispata]|uniref:Uncharacterized protein n=1 Tax=Elysia crispata TaxID=231223 RepID=A0AAE1DP91_9GAST|nr:hypothetical protein RRG08_035273 [Elysia crispata]
MHIKSLTCALHILMTPHSLKQRKPIQILIQALTFDAWCALQKEKSPQFLFWTTCLDLQLLVFSFVRAIRTANFELYLTKVMNKNNAVLKDDGGIIGLTQDSDALVKNGQYLDQKQCV